MGFSLTWLPEVLKAAGLKVALVPGWETRGAGDVSHIVGVICHHTAGPLQGNMPSLKLLTNGRGGKHPLPGPLSQLGLGRDGTFYVIAAGRANHAGKGRWQSFAAGNSSFIGIEAENTGLDNDPWPEEQMDAYRRGVAAILIHIQRGAAFCAGHKEYALPKGRKSDPSFDMERFRASVAAVINGTAAPAPFIPAVDPQGGRPTLRRGAEGPLVSAVQAAVGVPQDGSFGPKTEAAVRGFQRSQGLLADGIVGPKTWAMIP
jgi:peptidoglycan hydrolase-like protein with peptidoglycan-binding domain